MNVLEFMEKRPKSTYGKHIRILDHKTHKNLGNWYDGDIPYKGIYDIKWTAKYIFIFV